LDYVEVDEDDPFLPPRNGGASGGHATAAVNNTTNTNLDVYGSNLYNPRTRFASTYVLPSKYLSNAHFPGIPTAMTWPVRCRCGRAVRRRQM
jgi:hypothetical protein